MRKARKVKEDRETEHTYLVEVVLTGWKLPPKKNLAEYLNELFVKDNKSYYADADVPYLFAVGEVHEKRISS